MKLPPIEAELYRRCDEVLHYLWDPIGVAGEPAARDEYDSYLPDVFRMVRDDAGAIALEAYLRRVESERMAMSGGADRRQEAVAALQKWGAWLRQQQGLNAAGGHAPHSA